MDSLVFPPQISHHRVSVLRVTPIRNIDNLIYMCIQPISKQVPFCLEAHRDTCRHTAKTKGEKTFKTGNYSSLLSNFKIDKFEKKKNVPKA